MNIRICPFSKLNEALCRTLSSSAYSFAELRVGPCVELLVELMTCKLADIDYAAAYQDLSKPPNLFF